MKRPRLQTVAEASRIEAQAVNPFAGAYSYGWSEHLTRGNTPWDDAESDLRDRWAKVPCNAGLSWDQARDAIRDGWEHVSPSKH